MGKSDEYLHTVERMEPDVHPVDKDGALASLAISARRIANSLEALQAQLSPGGVCELVRHLAETRSVCRCVLDLRQAVDAEDAQ